MQTAEFLRFADCFTEALLMLSRQGSLLAVNGAGRELLGAVAGGAQSPPLAAFVSDPPERLDGYLAACALSEQPVVCSLHFNTRQDGGQMLCQGRGIDSSDPDTPILLRCLPSRNLDFDTSVMTTSLQQLHREIRRRQEVEARLQAAIAHAQAVLDMTIDAIITIDQQGLIQSFSRGAERVFGYPAAAVVGHNVSLLMPAPYHDQHDDYIRHYLETGEKRIIGIGREVQALRQDGTVFPIELAVSEIWIGKARHFTGIIHDISERKRAEQRLRQREEEARQQRERLVHVSRLSTLGELAAGIAHEINQPLTAIAAYANACQRLLVQGGSDPGELQTTLDKISTQAQRAGQVIKRLRGMIRRRESRREPCELNRLVQDTLVLAEADARLHAIRITTVLAAQPLLVVVDPIQIQQVLLNLIRNGIDAMLEAAVDSGEIVVQTRLHDTDDAEVRVCDQGVGIPTELRSQLFRPFFTTKTQGIGLGLSISRSIITSHGGRLFCEPNPERGVTMAFVLPLALESAYDG